MPEEHFYINFPRNYVENKLSQESMCTQHTIVDQGTSKICS